ncbi:MAG: hypothetical protein CMF50_10150 [Legionellales bacterium]|nr:hypothetical protein [Legionellales bacterium]|tara:strand:- start:23260 stop:23727 length:468 start_codon:yes stop_codon:yes gene_type:complete
MNKYIVKLPSGKTASPQQTEVVIALPSPVIDPDLAALKALLNGKQPHMFCIYSNNPNAYFDNHAEENLIMLKVNYYRSKRKPLDWLRDITNQNDDRNRWFTNNAITDITAVSVAEQHSEKVTRLIQKIRHAEIHEYHGKENKLVANVGTAPLHAG